MEFISNIFYLFLRTSIHRPIYVIWYWFSVFYFTYILVSFFKKRKKVFQKFIFYFHPLLFSNTSYRSHEFLWNQYLKYFLKSSFYSFYDYPLSTYSNFYFSSLFFFFITTFVFSFWFFKYFFRKYFFGSDCNS